MLNLAIVERQMTLFFGSLRANFGAQYRPVSLPDRIQFDAEFYNMSSHRIEVVVVITPSRITASVIDARKITVFTESFTDDINSRTKLIAAIKAQAKK